MTVVEDPIVAETPDASPGGRVFGDGFVWYPADPERGFDPVTDIAIGDMAPGADWIAAVVEHCAQGLALLESIDPSEFDAATTTAWAIGVEQLRRQATAAGIAVADHLDAALPFRDQGFFTAKAWMKHRLQLSGPEAHGRVQEAKLRRAVRVWNNAVAGGQVGVAQTRLMARIAANPRIPTDVLTRGVWQLMVDAMDVSYIEFERRALTFEALADPIGAAEKTERNRTLRTASMHQQSDGSWSLHARLDDVGGPEFLEIFCWYVDREFTKDWTEATHRLGNGNVDVSKLRRTETQRRADALLEMARAAAACPPDRQRPLPTVNFLLDEHTARAAADGHPIDPLDYRNVTSRTDRGHRVDPNTIIGVSLWALIRRVITNTPGVIIELGRTTRLFTGYARAAVMLLEPACIWPGCDQPHTWCHADHLTAWSTRGPTNPDNGAPLCARHNYLKTLGFTITRDNNSHWHITTPDGTQIC
ncbi:MAG TPA: HNH endonuclease signature motif containing protein [Ilumatobacteraceae bacterium]|nr:HNH endonuclease signature motif containing protein [Ilumatobacteraceae bacterium]